MTIRIWIDWHNSPAKITLSNQSKVHLSHAWETDEGYGLEAREYSIKGNKIICNTTTGGQDCDGPIRYHNRYECSLARLKENKGHPVWHRVSESVYDQYAQAMGY